MKIVHCCLSNFYIDDFSYQENELVRQNVIDGHNVTVIASTETFDGDRRLTYIEPSEYIGTEGAKVIRIPYRRFFPKRLVRKLRTYRGLYRLLVKEAPDVILFHGLSAWELRTLVKYKRNFLSVKIYLDNHADFNNSAKTFLSKWGLHYLFYKPILQRSLKFSEAVLCISMDSMEFAREFYKVPNGKIEFFPLGGKILKDQEYVSHRKKSRKNLEVTDQEIVFIHSGKIDSRKKIIQALNAFSAIKEANVRFLIVGYLFDDIKDEVLSIMKHDRRIIFCGWKTPDQLREILCGADIYVQPGSQSATMQMSLCCRCLVILDNVLSHQPFVSGNGWLVESQAELVEAFLQAHEMAGSHKLLDMSMRSKEIADELLDYKNLASRLYR